MRRSQSTDSGQQTPSAYSDDVSGFLSWWDGFELWLSGRGFVLQTLIVMPVVLLLGYLVALTLDTVLGTGIRAFHRLRGDGESGS